MKQPRKWTDEENEYLIQTWSTQSIAEQAAHLDRSELSVRNRRCKMIQAGTLDPAKALNVRSPVVGRALKARIEELLHQGYTGPMIARKLKRPRATIYHYTNKDGGVLSVSGRGLFLYTPPEIAALFGLAPDAANRWIRNGWITIAVKQSRRLQNRMITYEALLAFLSNRETWPAWTVDQIVDPDWRETAREIRSAAGGEWVSVAAIAERYSYHHRTVWTWVSSGLFPRVIRAPQGWFVWSEDIEPVMQKRAA